MGKDTGVSRSSGQFEVLLNHQLPLNRRRGKAINSSWAFAICQGLKLNIKKEQLRSWHTVPSLHGKEVGKKGSSGRFYFPGLQNHCRRWLQPWNERNPLLGSKAMANPDSVLKSRDLTWLTQVCMVKAMVLPVVMYECESWPIKKAECCIITAFELWC